jgi:hypothetical protein
MSEGQIIVSKDTDKWMLILYKGNHEDFYLKGILKIASYSPQKAQYIVNKLKKQPQVIIAMGEREKLIVAYETLILAFIEVSLLRISHTLN